LIYNLILQMKQRVLLQALCVLLLISLTTSQSTTTNSTSYQEQPPHQGEETQAETQGM
jgi:hypothetical protein